MKNLLCLVFAGILFMGCKTWETKPPALHMPDPSNTRTNQVTSRVVTVDTNASKVQGHLQQSSSNLVAYLQIASDADVAEEFGPAFKDCFYVGEVVIQNNSTNSLLAYASSLQVNIAYYVAERDFKRVKTNLLHRFGREYILTVRRPAIFSDILAIFEFQRHSNGRQQAMDWLKSAGEMAAGAAVFVGGPTYPKAVAFATGIVTPELEKRLLWDILLHAKNLEARSLKEIEEISPNAAIHKIVFFPKRGIPGVLDDALVYISSFKPYMPILVSGSYINKLPTPATSGSVQIVKTEDAENVQ